MCCVMLNLTTHYIALISLSQSHLISQLPVAWRYI